MKKSIWLGYLIALIRICTFSTKGQDIITIVNKESFEEILTQPTNPAGYTGFNLTDRMAVRNILGAYYMTYDEHMIEANADLYWPEAEFIISIPGRTDIILTKESWIKTVAERTRVYREINLQRRHVMGEVLFLEEYETSIHTVCNALATSANNQKDVFLSLSILYEAWFEKRDNIWKIIRFKIISDVGLDVDSEVKE